MDWVINKQREQQSTVCKHIRHSRAFPAVVQRTVGWPFWPTVSRRNSDEMGLYRGDSGYCGWKEAFSLQDSLFR